MTVVTRVIDVVRINGSHFTEHVVIPVPRHNVFRKCDIEDLCYNVFDRTSEVFTDETSFVRTTEALTVIEDVLIDELERVCRDSDIHISGDVTTTIENVVRDVMPDSDVQDEAPTRIFAPPVVTHLTRVFLQSSFDLLDQGVFVDTEKVLTGSMTTHMTVENPLRIAGSKWNNMNSDGNASEKNVLHISRGTGVSVSGEFFTENVIMHAPNNNYMYGHHASSAIEETFESVIREYRIDDSVTDTPIAAPMFIERLEQLLIDTFVSNCNVISSDAKSVVKSEVKRVFSTINAESSHASMQLRDETMLLHITRMVTQTILDQLTEQETHMTVTNPLRVSTHNWENKNTVQ